jgi:Cerato-platanin
MIYLTTFIFTLLLAHIARAVPACGDVASPEEVFDTYDYELVLDSRLATYNVTYDDTYDKPLYNTNGVACDTLSTTYPQLRDFPSFPRLGGSFDAARGTPTCGKCWKLSSKKSGGPIYITAIDKAGVGFNIATSVFIALNGGTVGAGKLEAEAEAVSPRFCGFR